MIRYFAAYAVVAIVMIVIDLLWLGIIAKPMYQQGIGHLMAEQPKLGFALLFYILFPLGLMFFALLPNELSTGWSKTLIAAALFGFFTYATYDLTNLATLKNWPLGLSILDIAWGSLLSVIAAAAGKYVLNVMT